MPFNSCRVSLTNPKAALQNGQDVCLSARANCPLQTQKLPFDAALQDGQDADPHGVQQRLQSGIQHVAGSQPHLGHHYQPLLFLSAHLRAAGADCVLHNPYLYGILAVAACKYVHR